MTISINEKEITDLIKKVVADELSKIKISVEPKQTDWFIPKIERALEEAEAPKRDNYSVNEVCTRWASIECTENDKTFRAEKNWDPRIIGIELAKRYKGTKKRNLNFYTKEEWLDFIKSDFFADEDTNCFKFFHQPARPPIMIFHI